MRATSVLLALTLAGFAPSAALSEGQATSTATGVPTPAARSVIYYFHATTRCATCRTIEAYAHETVTTVFAADLKAGSLQWRTINVDEPANQHYIRDFQLYARSVVVVDAEDPKRFKVLDRVWQLVRDKQAFQRYVEQEVRAFRRT